MHVAEPPVAQLREGQRIDVTFYWTESKSWEGHDYSIEIR
jgi:hypothetical protein